MDSSYLKAASLFQALADPTRLELLRRIEPAECCASELHTALGMSQPRIARHLKILVDAGLVSSRRDGRFVRYLLTPEPAARGAVVAALSLLGSGAPGRNEVATHRTEPRPATPGRTVLTGQAPTSVHPAVPTPEPPDDDLRGTLEDFLL